MERYFNDAQTINIPPPTTGNQSTLLVAYLHETHIGHNAGAVHRNGGNLLNPLLHHVRGVRHHLHRLAQVVPAALPVDHLLMSEVGKEWKFSGDRSSLG